MLNELQYMAARLYRNRLEQKMTELTSFSFVTQPQEKKRALP